MWNIIFGALLVIIGQILYAKFKDFFSQSTQRLNEGFTPRQDENDSQVETTENATGTSSEINQMVSIENNNNGRVFNSDDMKNGSNNFININKVEGILTLGSKILTWAIGSYKPKVYGVYYDNRKYVVPNEMEIPANGRRRSHLETLNKLNETLKLGYKNNFNEIFMLETDEDFSFHLEKVFIHPDILPTTLSRYCDSNCQKRFLLVANYGMGKKIWLRHLALHISGKGSCPYFDTTGYRLLVLCDVTKLNLSNEETFENILINYIRKNNKDLKDFTDTEQLIRQYGDRIICFIYGYEFIKDENHREKIKQFFKRGFENPNVFESALIVFSISESVEKCSKKFLANFDSKLSLQGIPKNKYRNMIRNTFGIDEESAIVFEKSLGQLGLKFVEDMSPRMYVVCYYIYQKYKPETTYECLKKMLILEGIEYLKQSKRKERRQVLEKEVKSIFRRIGRVLWNIGKCSAYYDTIFENNNFEKDDLRLVQNLGLLFSDNGQTYQVKHQLIYEFFVVYYLKVNLARKNLENQINEFNRRSSSKIHVVTGYLNGKYVLNCIYLSPASNLFTLVFYRMDDSFHVDYFIHRDFRDRITKLCESHFTIDIGSIDNYLNSQVPTIVPLKFEYDNYVKELTENREGDLRISITYPGRHCPQSRVTQPSPEMTLNTYSYHVNINGGINEMVYRVNLLQGDIYSLSQFISGFYKMLSKWMKSSVEFAISEQHIRLVFDNLRFANKVLNIGFGAEISENGSTDLLEAVNDWRIHFVNNCEEYNWLILVNQVVVAKTGQEALNLNNVHQSGLTDLNIVLKFYK